jgi:hypothetical protein
MYPVKLNDMAITQSQFKKLDSLFQYYNRVLFNSMLPECIISIWRGKRYHGAFSTNKWKERGGETPIHEIVLNANTMDRAEIKVHSTIIHEMVHLMLAANGRGSKYDYHTREWCAKMKELGLYPSSTGMEGGRETGRNLSQYVIPGGRFEKAFEALRQKDAAKVLIPYVPLRKNVYAGVAANRMVASGRPSRSGVKVAYECPCGCKVWGKSGLHLHCNICNKDFQMQ